MTKYVAGLLLLSLIICSSCVPHKNIVYLQDRASTATNDSLPKLNLQNKPYRVQINDILNITIKVLDQDDAEIFNPTGDGSLQANAEQRAYFDGFTVNLQGMITVPQIGEFKVLGMTVKEIEEFLKTKLLEEQFREFAQIFITVKLSGLRYSTIGEIARTGSQVLFQERATIFEAIANAGDISIEGNRKDVLLIRQYPHGQEIHHLDLTSREVMQSQYYYIQPNDMIYVVPLKQKTLGTGTNALQTFTTVVGILSVVTSTVLLLNNL